MNAQNKRGIRIIAGLMFFLGFIMIIFQLGFLLGAVTFEGSEDYMVLRII
jgi:hypothetical protein